MRYLREQAKSIRARLSQREDDKGRSFEARVSRRLRAVIQGESTMIRAGTTRPEPSAQRRLTLLRLITGDNIEGKLPATGPAKLVIVR